MTEETIFNAAREKQDPVDRAAYLDEACAQDPAMRQRVEALLRSHEDSDFLINPALGTGGPARDRATPTEPSPAGGIELDFLSPSEKPGVLGRLDHYDVLSVVGQGGMGVVLMACLMRFQRRVVALKVMAPKLAVSASARKRFAREAQAAVGMTWTSTWWTFTPWMRQTAFRIWSAWNMSAADLCKTGWTCMDR